MKTSNPKNIRIDIMDARDGIFLGSILIDVDNGCIIDCWKDKLVLSYIKVKRIIVDRRPTLKNRDLDLASSVAIFNKYN